MIKELRDKWIADLKSGNYIQGEGTLRSVDDSDSYIVYEDGKFKTPEIRHCCLGVLLETGAKNGFWEWDWNTRVIKMKDPVFEIENEWDETIFVSEITVEDESLPKPLITYIRLDDEDILIKMNDGDATMGINQTDFNGIADYIKEHE